MTATVLPADGMIAVLSDVPYSCLGRIDSGPILEKFAALARAVREQKDKAA